MYGAPWGTLTTERWSGTPLPDVRRSLGYPHNGKVVGHYSSTSATGTFRIPSSDSSRVYFSSRSFFSWHSTQ